MLTFGLALVAGAVVGALGAPNPTEPSGSSVFNVGKDCTIKWDADSTGSWKKMNVQLMTGDNLSMVHITTVAQDIDATDATKNTYTYTCPDVTPTSAIYFYQFSDPSDPKNLLWTTRWTLASADGTTTTPTETTQPNGDKIPWGKGALVDPSTAVPPPTYLPGQTGPANSTSTGSSSAAPSVVVATSSAPAATTSAPRTTAAGTNAGHSTGASTSTPARPATTGPATGASSSTNSTAQTNTNGATATAVSGFAMVGALVAALGLF